MKRKLKGLSFILCATLLWAINGNLGPWLFHERMMSPETLVFFRLIGAGLCFYIYNFITRPKDVFNILRVKSNYLQLLIYGGVGILLMQYGYFKTIYYSNAPTATLIQYLGIFIIFFYVNFKARKVPPPSIFLALVFCVVGVFLLVAGGDIENLDINNQALFWGLVAAVGLSTHSLSPARLQSYYRNTEILGPAMLIASFVLLLFVRPDVSTPLWSPMTVVVLLLAIFFGTFVAFLAFMTGLKLVSPDVASVFGLAEPIFSTIIALLLYNIQFTWSDYSGMALIMASIVILLLIEEDPPTDEISK